MAGWPACTIGDHPDGCILDSRAYVLYSQLYRWKTASIAHGEEVASLRFIHPRIPPGVPVLAPRLLVPLHATPLSSGQHIETSFQVADLLSIIYA